MSDNKNIDRVFKRSALLSVSRLLQVAVIFLVFWFFSITLSKEQYGLYQKTFVILSLLSGLLCLGIPVLVASLPATGAGTHIRFMLKRFAWIYVLIVIVAAIAIFFFMPFLDRQTGIILLALSIINAASLVAEAYLVKLQRDTYVLVNNLLYSAGYILLHYFAVIRPTFDVATLLTWLLFLSAAKLIFAFMVNRAPIRRDLSSANNASGATYFSQWKFLSLNEVLDIFSRQIDKLFLLWLLSAAEFAAYFNGTYEIPLIGILISTSGTFMTMHAVQEPDNASTKKLLNRSAMILACIVFPLFFFLFFYAGNIFHFFFRNIYNDAVPVFMISCCIIPLRVLNYTAILQARQKGKQILTGSILGLVIKAILGVALYYAWGTKGVALAYILGTFVQITYYLLQTARSLGTGIEQMLSYKRLLLYFLLTGGIIYLSTFAFASLGEVTALLTAGLLFMGIAGASLMLLLKKKGAGK